MTGVNELADSKIGGLLLCGLGVVSMSLGLSWYRLKSRNQSKIGLAFWALIGAAIFLLPAALAEQVYLTGWALNQFAAGAALALSFLIGLACWVWLEDRDRPNEDRLPLALTPLLGLVFLILPLGLEIKSWEVTGLILVGLALHISGRTEAGEPAEISQPLPFEQETTEPIEQRKVA